MTPIFLKPYFCHVNSEKFNFTFLSKFNKCPYKKGREGEGGRKARREGGRKRERKRERNERLGERGSEGKPDPGFHFDSHVHK